MCLCNALTCSRGQKRSFPKVFVVCKFSYSLGLQKNSFVWMYSSGVTANEHWWTQVANRSSMT